MKEKIKSITANRIVKQLFDVRNIGLYIFGLIALSITWSGIKVVQTNYGLQKQIATLEQEAAISDLQNANLNLKNQYYQTDQFLELAARRQFGLALPGEKMLLVPKDIALKYITKTTPDTNVNTSALLKDLNKPPYQLNLEAWIDFFLHRQPTELID